MIASFSTLISRPRRGISYVEYQICQGMKSSVSRPRFPVGQVGGA